MRLLAVLLMVICACFDSTAGASPDQVTQEIDTYFRDYWEAHGTEVAQPASRSEFLRRVCLDLTGVIPTVNQTRECLDESHGFDSERRAQIIDQLLSSPRHATHLANQWRNILLPDMSGFEAFEAISGTQTWLRERFLQNLRYDRLVGEFLTVTGSASTGPVLYYQSNEFKPEKLAAGTARSFFGIQLQCAECHDHPFDHWKQEDFWGYAAFFARVGPDDRAMMTRTVSLVEAPAGEVTLPDQQTPILPRFLDGEQPDESSNRRLQLSLWAASQNNPYIARAAVNRVWAMLFGRGLSEPVDDLGSHNPPDHPELLDKLASRFVESGYDLRQLFSAIAKSEVYALSSTTSSESPLASSFARAQVKTLTADQLYDSLSRALRHKRWQRLNEQSSTETRDVDRARFISLMSTRTQNPTEFRAGLQQTLTLMNGTEFAQLLNDPTTGILASVQAPFFTDEQRLETLFLAVLSRMPTEDERADLMSKLSASGKEERPAFLADLLWALVNSAEFRMNH